LRIFLSCPDGEGVRHTPPQVPLSGWPLVEGRLASADDRLRVARTADQFAVVGDVCVEALWLVLSILLTDSDALENSVRARLGDSGFELLKRYISRKLVSPDKDAALGNLGVVESRHRAGIADAQSAKRCLAAARAVVDSLSPAPEQPESRETIGDLCEKFVKERSPLGKTSQLYAMEMLSKMPVARRVASQLTKEHVLEHVRTRREEVSAATATRDVSNLLAVLKHARMAWHYDVSTDAVVQAKAELKKAGLIGKSMPRDRRPTREEIQRLVNHFEGVKQVRRTKLPMKDLIEFALWSARRIGEICDLRWADVDEKVTTCKVRLVDARGRERIHQFPLLEKARDIVLRLKAQRDPGEERIFPYNSQSASAAYTIAKKKIGIENLRFQDLRREAAIRLYEAGYSVERISEVTGRIDLNTLLRDVARPVSAPVERRAEPLTAKAEGAN
jgi:integrase